MTIETKIDDGLDAAFRVALVLTGSSVAAERAVIEAVGCIEPELADQTFLIETARSAIRQRGKFVDAPDTASMLPLELRALALLSPVCRDCFVLRVLAGLGAEVCSGLLNLSQDGVEDALREALLDLPRAVDSLKFLNGSLSDGSGSG